MKLPFLFRTYTLLHSKELVIIAIHERKNSKNMYIFFDGLLRPLRSAVYNRGRDIVPPLFIFSYSVFKALFLTDVA